MDSDLTNAAVEVADLLKGSRRRLVLAESCTGGLVAASLVAIAGISDWLTGSAVVYRDDTKARWLGVSETDLADPDITAVSDVVARQMAVGVLCKTPEADFAAATTGHLGPGAPADVDGLVIVAAAHREGERIVCRVERIWLSSPSPAGPDDYAGRAARQREAALFAMQRLWSCLKSIPDGELPGDNPPD